VVSTHKELFMNYLPLPIRGQRMMLSKWQIIALKGLE